MYGIFDFFRGGVRVEAAGSSPEEFLNALAERGIAFSRPEPVDGCTLRLTLGAAELRAAERAALRCQCELRVLRRTGAPAFTRRVRRRVALAAGLGLCFALLGASSLFVWEIDVEGNERVSTGEILRALADSGVDYGSFWPAWRADEVKNELILALPELSWVGVTVDSSRARVEVRERVPAPELVDNDEPHSVVASSTGIVTRVDAYMGTPLVKAGDAVFEGEELVSSLMSTPGGEHRQVHAQADVTARTWYELSAAAPLTETVRGGESSSHSRWALVLGKTRLNFYRDSGKMGIGCDKIVTEYPLELEGVFTLPLKLVRERYVEYEAVERSADRDALRERLESELLEELGRRLGGRGEVLNSTFSAAESGGLLTVTLRAECEQNIAAEVPLTQ